MFICKFWVLLPMFSRNFLCDLRSLVHYHAFSVMGKIWEYSAAERPNIEFAAGIANHLVNTEVNVDSWSAWMFKWQNETDRKQLITWTLFVFTETTSIIYFIEQTLECLPLSKELRNGSMQYVSHSARNPHIGRWLKLRWNVVNGCVRHVIVQLGAAANARASTLA